MELFIPSLLAFLIAVLVTMFLMPRLSPILLGVLALVFLVLAAQQHFTFFATEYRQSTWQLSLFHYAPYIVLGVLVLFLIIYIVRVIGFSSDAAAMAPVASINAALNKTTANLNNPPGGVIDTVKGAAGAAVAGVTNAATNAFNTVKNVVTSPVAAVGNLFGNKKNGANGAAAGRANQVRYPFSSV